MHFTTQAVITFIAFASTFVQSAPTPALDVATLLKNGQEAQKLNAQFQTIKLSDACGGTGLTTACVGNAISNCVNNAWDSTNGTCSKSQQCFAIPNVQSDGTILSCTSEKSALSIINATGAKGGIAGADASGSTDARDPPTSSNPSSSSSVAQPSGATPVPTVTVTVTIAPAATTLPATIITLSPQEASGAISSILGQGIPTPSTASSASATSIDSASSTATISLPPSTIILLTAAPEPSAPASSSAPALSSASAAVASISTSSDASGGYGYGGY